MTIFLPASLPAASELRNEGYDVRCSSDAPADALRIALVNLMPRKEATEVAFARLMAQSGRPVALSLVIPAVYQPHNTPSSHLEAYYRRWPDVREQQFDSLIVTGAPVERMAFEAVSYWAEMQDMVGWSQARAIPSLYICWAAQAALYLLHGCPKTLLLEKAFGVFEQDVYVPASSLMRGMGARFPVPVSRHTEVDRSFLTQSDVTVLAGSAETGASIVEDHRNRAVFVFDHLEYGRDTLMLEFERDRQKGLATQPPQRVDHSEAWQPYAALFFRNWLDEAVAVKTQPEEGESLTWLFEERCPRNPRAVEILLQVEPHSHLLSQVMTQLASVGVDPTFARVQVTAKGRCRVGIQIEAGSSSSMERVADALLALPGARRLLIRVPNGSGGLYRPRPRATLARAA